MSGPRRVLIFGPLAFITALALITGGCGGSDESEQSKTGTLKVAGITANDHGTKDVAAASEVEVELDDDYFKPTVLAGRPSQKVKLELKNEGSVEHNFTFVDMKINRDLEPGQKAEVEVILPDAGSVGFYCKYHKSAGMAGILQASA